MKSVRLKLDKSGRVVIPASFRNNLNVSPGDELVLQMKNKIIYVTTPEQALETLQQKIKSNINVSLVDELIKQRREASKNE